MDDDLVNKLKAKLKNMKEEAQKRRELTKIQKYELKKKIQRENYHKKKLESKERISKKEPPLENSNSSEVLPSVLPKKNTLKIKLGPYTAEENQSTSATTRADKNCPKEVQVKNIKRKVKVNNEEQRKKAREKKRRQREKRRQNIEAYTKYTEREKERNKKRKEEGKLTPIMQKNTREKKRQRKKWTENSRAYRLKKNQQGRLEKIIDEKTSPLSSSTSPPEAEKNSRVKTKRTSTKNYREYKKTILDLRKSLKTLGQRAERYKKRYNRLSKKKRKQSRSPSPNTNVKNILRQTTNDIKKKLLFSECLVKEIKAKAKDSNEVEKNILGACISSSIYKKYRVQSEATSIVSRHILKKHLKSQINHVKKRQLRTQQMMSIRRQIENFFLEDENTIPAPGKRDTITKRKITKQKRYLTTTLKILYKKYVDQLKSKISFSTFCRLRPFYVLKPRVSNRDTCLCIKHENVKFILQKLHYFKIVRSKIPSEVIRELVCNHKDKNCMYRECQSCKNKKCHLANEELSARVTFYYEWKSRVEERKDKNGKEIKVRITAKERISCSVQDLVKKINDLFPKFLIHEYNIQHHFKKIKQLRQNISSGSAIINIDFSENYGCKYSNEIQSVHFGASKPQLSLHTGVIYFKIGDKLHHQSFTTVSDQLCHKPYAIWAHLQPALELATKLISGLDTIHFISDGPTSQYRNKINFFLITYFGKMRGFKKLTWNFSEAGHGKSSADGVGGSLKKMADLAVSHGNDIMCAKDFVHVLHATNPQSKIKLFLIEENEFDKFQDVVPLSLKSIKGTMRIHQVLWKSDNPQKLKFKYLSCFCEDCSHYELCEIVYPKNDNDDMILDKNYEIENEIINNIPVNSPDDSVLSKKSRQACSKTSINKMW
ncbi:unnamed protein product [Brassicogethes aeneus]|uniref:Uncharacterized protein n=1 Tax=Brassicogethes aeneus TaxID=1431903 RepID=A0A9P0ATR8_BRAAE|nr:unnamed protein product [Brassicogethes aeneus]